MLLHHTVVCIWFLSLVSNTHTHTCVVTVCGQLVVDILWLDRLDARSKMTQRLID